MCEMFRDSNSVCLFACLSHSHNDHMCTDILLCIPWVLCCYFPHTPPHSQVVIHGNVSLGDDKIDKLVVLRMNREFMKFGANTTLIV